MSTATRDRGSLEIVAENVSSLEAAKDYALDAFRKFMNDPEAALPWSTIYKARESAKFTTDAAPVVSTFDVIVEMTWEAGR